MAATTDIVQAIETELARLGALCTDTEPTLCVVHADDDLPAGWVRLADEHGDVIANADAALDALRGVADGSDYENVWLALHVFYGNRDDVAREQALDLGETVTASGTYRVSRLPLNAGECWVFHPAAREYGVSSYYHDFSDRYQTPEEALEAAEEWEAQEG